MKIQSVLYYRYFFWQVLSVFLVSLVLISTINFVVFFQNTLKTQIWILVSVSLLWLFPLYLLVINTIFLIKYLKYKKQVVEIELLEMIKNSNIRKRISLSKKRFSYVFPKKEQEADFFEVINKEVEKQKNILKIKKGNY